MGNKCTYLGLSERHVKTESFFFFLNDGMTKVYKFVALFVTVLKLPFEMGLAGKTNIQTKGLIFETCFGQNS